MVLQWLWLWLLLLLLLVVAVEMALRYGTRWKEEPPAL